MRGKRWPNITRSPELMVRSVTYTHLLPWLLTLELKLMAKYVGIIWDFNHVIHMLDLLQKISS